MFQCAIFSRTTRLTPYSCRWIAQVCNMKRFAELDQCLPSLDTPFTFVHLKSDPKKCRRLIYKSKARRAKTPLDKVVSHLFVLSHNDLAVYAMEILVYESLDCWTLFVSKVDTSGHYYADHGKFPLSFKQLTTGIIRALITYHIPASGKPLRVCLFGKSHRQYLFPLSSDNSNKKILSDAALIKWWLQALDPLATLFQPEVKATLQIPGSDRASIKAFFPTQPTLPWEVGDVFANDLPAVKCIPRFPDDPKGRFLDYLVHERRALKVSKQQFFLELQYRQEFRLGSVVGIIGIQGHVKPNALPSSIQQSHSIPVKRYDDLRDCLLSQDFSSLDSARLGTAAFLSRVGSFAKIEIIGKRSARTDLKRKDSPSTPAVNVLSTSIVRKKPKAK